MESGRKRLGPNGRDRVIWVPFGIGFTKPRDYLNMARVACQKSSVKGHAAHMKTLDEYLALAAQSHGHMCPGQVLGVRMAMLGLKELGLDDPVKHRKRLITFVEIDRCATEAVSLVTGCRLGKRSLKFVDYGKVAATFVDLETSRAVRVVARDDSREKAKAMFEELSDLPRQQLEAYKVMPDSDLFIVRCVRVRLKPEDLPGRPRSRRVCEQCGEGVNDGRERLVNGRILCRSCAGESYYEEGNSE
jgi:formylmethanofuran dehydrogenase subunit E